MPSKEKTLSKLDVRNARKYVALFLAGFMVLVFALSLDVHAAGKVKADGILTSMERDETVIIDNMEYLLSPSLKVQDQGGRPISLRDINLPQHVYFEYEYTAEGCIIYFIKENAV